MNHPPSTQVALAGKNALVRYCLRCSEETGYLVEQTCPAIDRGRERKRKQRCEKEKRSRAKVVARKQARKRESARSEAKRASAREEVAGDLHAEHGHTRTGVGERAETRAGKFER